MTSPDSLPEPPDPAERHVVPEPPEHRDSPAIRVAGVEHHFGTGDAQKQVLFDNHLTVQAGEIVIMTGQSGSGKTTLLTLIGTLRRVQRGELWVLGQPLHEASDAQIVRLRRRLGFIFQSHNLFSSLTALQNVRMALEQQIDRPSRSEENQRCRRMLEAVGLGDRTDYSPRRLSGGQKQRVAVARGLVHRPEIVLADEPTAALDEESGRRVVELFQREARTRGTAIVIVTHDHRILDVADRIVKMDFGHIARDTQIRETSRIGEMLSRCSIFDGVTIRTMTHLADRMIVKHYPAGIRIIRQNDPGDTFYLIRDGRVAVTRDPGAQHVTDLEAGDFFGETALLTGEPRNAHVDAITDVVVYALDAEAFQQAMAERASLDAEVRSSLFAD